MPTPARIARTPLLVWVALHAAYRLGLCGPPLGAGAFDALLASFTF